MPALPQHQFAFFEFDSLQVGNRIEDFAWLKANFLAVAEVATFVVGHGCAAGSIAGCVGWGEVDFNQPLVDVFEFTVPLVSPFGVFGIVCQQVAVGL